MHLIVLYKKVQSSKKAWVENRRKFLLFWESMLSSVNDNKEYCWINTLWKVKLGPDIPLSHSTIIVLLYTGHFQILGM